MGFKHSGLSTEKPYADESGYMGFSYNILELPKKAFNGHKHWISGWYDEARISLDSVDTPVLLRLDSFVDFEATGNNKYPVLLNVGTLYLQYNRAKGYNEGTPGDTANTVTITEAKDHTAVSYHRAALGKRATQEIDGLYFTVCDTGVDGTVDFALVSISKDPDLNVCQTTPIEALGPPSTDSPTFSPISAPTSTPTEQPSIRTTEMPSLSPTLTTTTAPTLTPSESPTPRPSLRTSLPTASATDPPSQSPVGAVGDRDEDAGLVTAAPVSEPSSPPSGSPISVASPFVVAEQQTFSSNHESSAADHFLLALPILLCTVLIPAY